MKLNQKLYVASFAVITIVVLLLWFSSRIALQVSEDVELSKKLVQVNQLSELMINQAQQYKQNAPRDYESYYRDVKVYFTHLQDSLDTLEAQIHSLVFDYFNRNTTTNALLSSKLVNENDEAFRTLESSYAQFNSGVWQQIGDNNEEPRLEWASDYIIDDTSGFLAQLHSIQDLFNQLVAEQRKSTVTYNYWLMGIISVLLISLLMWFNKTIVHRVIRVAKACNEVANGDYGFKVRDDKGDEIGQLVNDFNKLSGHTNALVSMFEKLNQSKTPQQSINLIRSETQSFVNSSHVFFLKQKQGKYFVDLISSGKNINTLQGKALLNTDTIITALDNQSLYAFDDVLAHTVKNKNAHFAKYLLNEHNCQSLLLLNVERFESRGVLIFAKASKEGFNQSSAHIFATMRSLFARTLFA